MNVSVHIIPDMLSESPTIGNIGAPGVHIFAAEISHCVCVCVSERERGIACKKMGRECWWKEGRQASRVLSDAAKNKRVERE